MCTENDVLDLGGLKVAGRQTDLTEIINYLHERMVNLCIIYERIHENVQNSVTTN